MADAAAPRECPTPHKVAYRTRAAARFFGGTDGLRSYRCVCGAWHLTKQLGRKRGAKQ